MYIVFADRTHGAPGCLAQTLEQAFAQIVVGCRLDYQFCKEEFGWKLILTDVERPELSPDPIVSSCIKSRDAKRDLMMRAIDGRIRGQVAVKDDLFGHARILELGLS